MKKESLFGYESEQVTVMIKQSMIETLLTPLGTSENIYGAVLAVTESLATAGCDAKDLVRFADAASCAVKDESTAAILFRALYFSPFTEKIMNQVEYYAFSLRRTYCSENNIRLCKAIIHSRTQLLRNPAQRLTYCKEFAFYQRMYRELFIFMMRSNTPQEYEINKRFLREFADDGGIDEEVFSACLEYVRNNTVEKRFFTAFIGKLNSEQRKIMLNSAVDSIRFDESMLDMLTDINRFRALIRMPADSRTVRYIRQNMQELMRAYPHSTAVMLISLLASANSISVWRAILDIAEKLPHPQYLLHRMNAVQNRSIISDLSCRPGDSIVTKAAVPDPEWVESLMLYADLAFTVNEDGQDCTVAYMALDRATPCFRCSSSHQSSAVSVSVNRLVIPADLAQLSTVAASVIEAVRRAKGEELEKETAQVKERIEAARKEREADRLRQSFDQLSREMNGSQTSIWNYKDKQSIECRLLSTQEGFYVSFRIGRQHGRHYVVKDAAAFMSAFSEGKPGCYGKETFLHDRQYFDEFSQKLLDVVLMLPAVRAYRVYDARYSILTNAAAEKLLVLHKGHTVNINDMDYRLTEETMSCEVTVTDDCTIFNSLAVEGQELLRVNHSLLCLRPNRGTASFVEGDERFLKVALFAYLNNGVNISAVSDQFAAEVYPTVHGKIRLGDGIRRTFEKSILTIKAYLDYADGTITLRTELFADGRRITPEEITGDMNQSGYSCFTDMIQSFGFKDNMLSGDDAYAFMEADLSGLKSIADVYVSDALAGKSVVKFTPGSVRIQYQNNMMTAFIASGEYSDEDLAAVIKAVRKKKKYVPISGNRIIRTDDDAAVDFDETVEDLDLDLNHLTETQRIPTARSLRALAHENNCEMSEYLREMIQSIRNFRQDETPLPQLETTLPDYQKDGFRWMSILSRYGLGGILADDMGLGKTVEVIALLKADRTAEPSLIVCPKSVVYNWKNELRRFAPDLKVVDIYGSAADRIRQLQSIPQHEKIICITSYDSLRNDIDLYQMPFCYLILDEAQYIKNVSARKSRSVKRLNARHCFALTGTPIENSVLDLWSIFDFILPGYLDNLTSFKSKYTKDDRYHVRIAKSVAPFILRRTKENVLTGLPEKRERILTAEMTPPQRKLYEAEKKQARDAMNAGGRTFDVLPSLMRLRQICVDPTTCIEDYNGGSGKMSLLADVVTQYAGEGHRILIFSQFVRALEVARTYLAACHIGCRMITGATPSEKRIEIADAFNVGAGEPVILISLKAGGTGLNLVGADTVIHLDPWWNAAAENQASDRAYRIGQTRNVEVIKLICEDSVEQKVIELQETKKKVADTFIANDESSVTSAALEDILFILE